MQALHDRFRSKNKYPVWPMSFLLALGLFALQSDTQPISDLDNNASVSSIPLDNVQSPSPETYLTSVETKLLNKIEAFKQLTIAPQPIVNVMVPDAGINAKVLNYNWQDKVVDDSVTFNPDSYSDPYTVTNTLSFDIYGDEKADFVYGNIGLIEGRLVVSNFDDGVLIVDSVYEKQPMQVSGGAIIMGHRDSTSPLGAMNNLHNVNIGSLVEVTLSDGTILTFKVNNNTIANKDASDDTKYQNGLWIFSCDAGEKRPDGSYSTSAENSQNYGAKLVGVKAAGEKYDLITLGLVK